nr:PASTA domain-containing protein [Propionibacteriaceae bacterium]
LIGTVSYLPPELVTSGRADARSDVYSAGVVLFELITGQKPHTGETPIQVAYAHVHNDVPAPSSRTTAGPVPPYLDALMARVTARDPNLRPPDAKVMLTMVRRVRAALRDGVSEDTELTQELSLPGRSHPNDVRRTPSDPTDYEVTQLVGSMPPPIRQLPDQEHSNPTVLDAPPPAVPRQAHQLSPDRLAEQRNRAARSRRRGWLALLLVLLLTTIAALAGWYYTEGRFTTAPELTTLTQSRAAEVAHGAGLDVVFEPEFSESISKGVVISTSPGPGEKIASGGRIAAKLSKGAERYSMPRVVGLPATEAEAALVKANLGLGRVKTDYSETVAKALVVKASVATGAQLKKQSLVYLTVSAGPKPIKIRNYENKSAADATSALQKAGFRVTVTAQNSSSVPAGLVISQTPDRGEGKANDTITLRRSLGPVMVTVPNVRSMGVKAATTVMRQAGFKVKTRPVLVNYLGLGYVAYSKPSASSSAPLGSTITLYTV